MTTTKRPVRKATPVQKPAPPAEPSSALGSAVGWLAAQAANVASSALEYTSNIATSAKETYNRTVR